jgi:F0F1-type ATP synthase epsilon subunit
VTIFLSYLLKVSVCTAVFYLAYILTLSKETFFKLNRVVILSAVLASGVLPIWTLKITKEILISHELRQDTFLGELTGEQLLTSSDSSTGWADFLPVVVLIIFLTGAAIVSLRNIYGVFQIFRIIKNSKKEIRSDVKIHISKNEVIPFSWFRNIIISTEDYKTNREVIIEHERAHIQLKHNYDLLFINTVAIIQWFNPIFWLLRKELITIHEYQADSRVLKNGIDARKYQYLLISKGTLQSFSIPVVNHLCSGNFKKRIKMMLKDQSNPNKAIKVLFLIPLLAIAVAAFAKTEYVISPPDVSLSNEIVISPPDVSLSKEIVKSPPDASSKSETIKEPQRDTQVNRDQVVPVTIMKNGTYSLGQWSSYSSNKNINEATRDNIDQVIKDIVSKMKYPKDSIHFLIKFEEGDLHTVNSDHLKLLLDVLKINGIKSISSERKTNEYIKLKKGVLSVKINDVGLFLVNNEFVTNSNEVEYLLKKHIEKLKSASNEPIIAEVQTSGKTPIEALNMLKDILQKENITNVNYLYAKKVQANEEFPKSLTTKIPKFIAPQMIYPEDAKKSATRGEFYVKIKSEKGVIKLAEVIDIKDDFDTPRCEPLIIVAYGRSTEVITEKSNETETAKGLASIKNELLRVTALLSQYDDPEWKNANHDFILQVIFELR